VLKFSGGEGPCSILDRKQRQGLKQKSKEFYSQRNNRKGHMERHAAGPRIQYSPELSWTSGFIGFFFIASGRSMFWPKDFGKETGRFSPWLIAMFGEHVDLLQSALQVSPLCLRNRDDKIYSVTASCRQVR
jgi:hypothetical protein